MCRKAVNQSINKSNLVIITAIAKVTTKSYVCLFGEGPTPTSPEPAMGPRPSTWRRRLDTSTWLKPSSRRAPASTLPTATATPRCTSPPSAVNRRSSIAYCDTAPTARHRIKSAKHRAMLTMTRRWELSWNQVMKKTDQRWSACRKWQWLIRCIAPDRCGTRLHCRCQKILQHGALHFVWIIAFR